MKRKLFFLTLLFFIGVNGFTQVVATQPPDIIQCSNEVFDLTQQDVTILGNYSPNDYTVAYFETETEAEANTNPIDIPQSYVPNEMTSIVYARLTSMEDVNTYDVTSFNLIISSWQSIPASEPSDLIVCLDENATTYTVDLTSKEGEILDNAGYSFSYYLGATDSEMGTNALANPDAFEWNPDEIEMIWVRIEDNISGCYTLVVIYLSEIECTDSTVSGDLRFGDMADFGCIDGPPAANVMVRMIHDNDVFYTYTDENGHYTFYNVPDGVNEISVLGQGVYTYVAEPISYQLTAPGVFEDIYFCLESPEPFDDVSVYLIMQAPRPGFPMYGYMVVHNLGNTTANGTVSLEFDDSLVSFVNSVPGMSQSGNTLSANYSGLQGAQYLVYYMEFLVEQPPTVNLGDEVIFTANVTTDGDDIDMSNNEDVLTLVAVNSYDPNDIACREGDYITEEQADGYLNYYIRFQNTGNADAINVRIEDVLDDKLDWETLQPLSASHDYRVEMENNTVQFIFDNIDLPGEEVNEPESHGYVAYRIKPKDGAEVGDIFEATASIYFDFNEAIVTNTATTEIQSIMGLGDNIINQFALYPNPAKNIVNITFGDSVTNSVTISVSDISGKIVLAKNISNSENSFDVSALTPGMYFVTLTTDGKKQTKKLMIE